MSGTRQNPWNTEGHAKRQAVQGMFNDIAQTYDLCNSVMSLRMHHRWRRIAVQMLNLQAGDTVVDVCSGTGDFFRPLRQTVGAEGLILGLDFSEQMLKGAAGKDHAARQSLADACHLPVQSNSVDGVSVGWGIRNVPDIDAAHREAFRVLKSSKRFVSIDMAQPRGRFLRSGSRFMTHRMLPALGSLFGKREAYTYLPKSTEKFLDRTALEASMSAAGFVDIGHRDLFMGNICIHWGTKP